MNEKTNVITLNSFNPYDSSLESGINLIEASAGTGKTFSIAMLVLRFILQKGFTIDQLLVVTFTNAAAQELRDRIRSRLVEVKNVLSGKPSKDAALNDWVFGLEDSSKAKNLLIDALADIDNASIFTIHGFCQRVLTQYALESGQVFGAELLQNISQVKQQIAEDYWRLQTYDRSMQQVGLLRTVATTPYELLKSIEGVRESSIILPKSMELDLSLDSLAEAILEVKPVLASLLAAIQTAIDSRPEMFKPVFVASFSSVKDRIEYWLKQGREQEFVFPLADLLILGTSQIYKDALNGVKFRKTKKLTADERKQAFLLEFSIQTDSLDSLEAVHNSLGIAFKQGLYQYVQIELESRLTKNNQLSFDNMIKRLSRALQDAPNEEANATIQTQTNYSQHLRQVLQDKFPVAMIDEFQDTDDAQWSIFSSLVNSSNYLYLIGDPKQAIYRFRGADIYSYLTAEKKADRKYNLATNWRSQATLVSAVNALFDVENPFLIEQINYHPVNTASQELKLVQNDNSAGLEKTVKPIEKLVLWELDKNPDQKNGYWLTSKGKPKEQVRTHVVMEILDLLNDQNQTRILTNQQQESTPLCPSDIAILVRSNPEAAAYQQALADYGLPAVLNSKTSVFASEQAHEVYHILHAVLRAGNQNLMRYALCQSWFGYTGNDIHELQSQQEHMDNWIISFQRYHERWESKGMLAMMQELMETHQVVQHLTQFANIERSLTNINHILELIQEAAISNRLSMVKTLEWLEDALQERVVVEGQELRLESDENAVNIVTIHSAKGLEYPIVFCPDLWAKTRSNSSGVVVCHKDGHQISDLGSEQLDEHRELTQLEERAEELRLLYVAVTRAKYRCYVAWADQRTLQQDNRSALAYLLKQQEGESWKERLYALLDKHPEAFDYQSLAVDSVISDHYQPCDDYNIQKNREIKRTIKANWMMSSYSALAYYSVHDADIPELPLDKAQEQENIVSTVSVTIDDADNQPKELQVELPKGPHTGNLVHELLEYTAFADLSDLSEPIGDSNSYKEYLKNRTEMIRRFAVDIEETNVLDELLENTVNTALDKEDTGFVLAKLDEPQCLKEMPFYFSVNQLDTLAINRALSSSKTYLPLSAQQMQGQLTGFIDLICEYQGRYYVMDYKTNSLDDYSVQSMTEAMREHNYGLQYWIYSLVLHRYLQQSLQRYDFNEHFGGVRYLFVRGMNPAEPMSGVFEDQPELETLETLSEVFS